MSEIPDDAELAETFYSQFEDEFENDESEDELDDEDDFSALVGQMRDALDQTASCDDTLAEAELPSADRDLETSQNSGPKGVSFKRTSFSGVIANWSAELLLNHTSLQMPLPF